MSKLTNKWLAPALIASFAITSPAWAAYTVESDLSERTAETVEDAIMQGDLGLGFRARIENVSVKQSANGQANTLATTMRYGTAHYQNFAALLEFNNVTAHANRAFNAGNSISPSKASRPVIADPKGTALTRAYLYYDGLPDTEIRLGRQLIELDNQRFVGSRTDRQTPQSYDAISVVNHTYPDIELFYAYVDQVNSVYQGSPSAEADRSNQSHLLNATWSALPHGDVTTYIYRLNDRHNRANSTSTYGARFAGEQEVSGVLFHYAIEGARQSNEHNNLTSYHAYYQMVEIGADLEPIKAKAGHELLSGNKTAGKAFRTPLGNHHNFLGTADMFETTPDTGVADTYFVVNGELYELDLELAYHRFKPDAGGGRLGYEWDLGASKSFGLYDLGFEYAKFNATGLAGLQDTNKLWLTASVKFS